MWPFFLEKLQNGSPAAFKPQIMCQETAEIHSDRQNVVKIIINIDNIIIMVYNIIYREGLEHMNAVFLKRESEMTNEELQEREQKLKIEMDEAKTDHLYYFAKSEIQEVWKEMRTRGIIGL